MLDWFLELEAALQVLSEHLWLFEVGQQVVVEAVDDHGFVAFPPRREVDPRVAEPQCKPRVPRVDGHHQQDPDDVLLQVRFGVVFEVHGHFPEGDGCGQDHEHAGHEPRHQFRMHVVSQHLHGEERHQDHGHGGQSQPRDAHEPPHRRGGHLDPPSPPLFAFQTARIRTSMRNRSSK
eukprot:scaffold360_cov374-Pavlova_lutheri.AAC.91